MNHPIAKVIDRLQNQFALSDALNQSDAELLHRFTNRGDNTAFEAMVRKHGPLVLGVCQRLLRDPADIDDAFQATFIVLLRKAGSLSRPERLAGWLFQVAYRTARKARSLRRHRDRGLQQLTEVAHDEPVAEIVWREMQSIFDEEVNRLPEKLRLPVVMCFLEGKTKRSAAELLGWAEGTFSCRLQKGRERLRNRLGFRGVSLSVGTLSFAMFQGTAQAVVSRSLITTTVQSAKAFAIGTGITGPIAGLAQGVLNSMIAAKVKLVASVALALGIVVSGTSWVLQLGTSGTGEGDGVAQAAPPGVGTGPAPRPGQAEKEAPAEKKLEETIKTLTAKNESMAAELLRNQKLIADFNRAVEASSAATRPPSLAEPAAVGYTKRTYYTPVFSPGGAVMVPTTADNEPIEPLPSTPGNPLPPDPNNPGLTPRVNPPGAGSPPAPVTPGFAPPGGMIPGESVPPTPGNPVPPYRVNPLIAPTGTPGGMVSDPTAPPRFDDADAEDITGATSKTVVAKLKLELAELKVAQARTLQDKFKMIESKIELEEAKETLRKAEAKLAKLKLATTRPTGVPFIHPPIPVGGGLAPMQAETIPGAPEIAGPNTGPTPTPSPNPPKKAIEPMVVPKAPTAPRTDAKKNLTFEIRQKEAAAKIAKAKFQLKKKEMDRYIVLHKSMAISNETLDTAKLELLVAEYEVEFADAALEAVIAESKQAEIPTGSRQ